MLADDAPKVNLYFIACTEGAARRIGFKGEIWNKQLFKDILRMAAIIILLINLLDIYQWTIFAFILGSWLIAFGVLNINNKYVRKAWQILTAVVAPPLLYLRRFIPPLAGIDFTPIVLIFGIYILKVLIYQLL